MLLHEAFELAKKQYRVYHLRSGHKQDWKCMQAAGGVIATREHCKALLAKLGILLRCIFLAFSDCLQHSGLHNPANFMAMVETTAIMPNLISCLDFLDSYKPVPPRTCFPALHCIHKRERMAL